MFPAHVGGGGLAGEGSSWVWPPRAYATPSSLSLSDPPLRVAWILEMKLLGVAFSVGRCSVLCPGGGEGAELRGGEMPGLGATRGLRWLCLQVAGSLPHAKLQVPVNQTHGLSALLVFLLERLSPSASCIPGCWRARNFLDEWSGKAFLYSKKC